MYIYNNSKALVFYEEYDMSKCSSKESFAELSAVLSIEGQ
jgi:hypothetical protein